ncbi:hypothetical protein ACFCZT_38175 [Streptomyces sp. NPDC056230]|uniref:hypothetical protein n=1 Tax=Streptomyces sp. NPDC056230 TaxID=3345754 RepID=UPI0035D5E40D
MGTVPSVVACARNSWTPASAVLIRRGPPTGSLPGPATTGVPSPGECRSQNMKLPRRPAAVQFRPVQPHHVRQSATAPAYVRVVDSA